MLAGNCWLLKLTPNEPRPHLWIVTLDPDVDGRTILVNVSTVRGGCDQTILLAKNEHPFLWKDSFVSYMDALIVTVSSLTQRIAEEGQSAVPQPQLSSHLLALVCSGISASEQTPKKVFKYYAARKSQAFPANSSKISHAG